MGKRKLTLALACVLAMTTAAQSKLDSVQHVREIIVVSKPAMREVVTSQKLKGELLEQLNTHSVADALRYFSGIQLKDYGGVGGIKTVNIRSMGTHHLGISYDGVQLGNAQNGQIDLGQFSLDNVEDITLYNGQKSAIFQPASDFGNAGAIYIRTKAPDFSKGDKPHLRFKVQYGSSDMLRLTGLWEQKLSQTVSSSVSAGFLTASGKYKFHYERKYPNGETAWDTTAVRQNGTPCRLDFERFGAKIGLPDIRVKRVLDKYTAIPELTTKLVCNSFLNDKMKRKYLRIVDERVKRFIRQSE